MAIETIESWWVLWVFHGFLQEMLDFYGSFQLCYAMFDKLLEGRILGSKLKHGEVIEHYIQPLNFILN